MTYGSSIPYACRLQPVLDTHGLPAHPCREHIPLFATVKQILSPSTTSGSLRHLSPILRHCSPSLQDSLRADPAVLTLHTPAPPDPLPVASPGLLYRMPASLWVDELG